MIDILHIVLDEKFIDGLVCFMNDVGGRHFFVCPVNRKPYSFQYIKNGEVIPETKEEIYNRLVLGEYHSVMFHYLQTNFYDLVKMVPSNKLVIWSAWGGDLYEVTYFSKPIIPLKLWKPLTKNLLNSYNEKTKPIQRIVKDVIKDILRIDLNRQRHFLHRIDYCATILPMEYDILKKRLHFRAKYLPFHYTSPNVEKILTCVDESANYILVGNSSDSTNNHLDVIYIVRNRNIQNELYIPMAYGDTKYQTIVVPLLSDSHITIQTDFIPKNEYSQFLSNCRVAIFGHIRQQALYNINRMLLQGSKVFFFKDSMAYQFYKTQGAFVFNIEDDLTQSSIDTLLTKEQMYTNINIIKKLWNYEDVKQKFIAFAKQEHLIS